MAGDYDDGLAWKLFSEGDYRFARREALRELVLSPERPASLYVAAAAAARLNPNAPDTLKALTSFAESEPIMPWAAMVAMDLGRLHAIRKEDALAVQWYERAFFNALTDACFRHTATELKRLFKENKGLSAQYPVLHRQVASIQAAPLCQACSACLADPMSIRRRRVRPEAWIVGFYRRLVAPAIGQRCELHPSCSEFFVQAGRAHGWLSIPLIADRAVREPGVAARAEHPVVIGGTARYSDPLEAHTFWLVRRRQKKHARFQPRPSAIAKESHP